MIYVRERHGKQTYPILWPDTFAQFVTEMHNLFPDTAKRLEKKKFLFKDACDFCVCVMSESTYQALVPNHKQTAPSVDVYYVTLEGWLT